MEAAEKLLFNKSTNVRSQLKREARVEAVMRSGFKVLSPMAPALSARLAERLFFRAQRYPTPARERAILETGHRLSFEVRGENGAVERLACWSWGDGPTVFLLHGWSGRAGQLGSFVEPLCRAGYSVIAFDAPAHGQSTGQSISAPSFARALSQVIARFGPAHAVIAHSMGGWAAAFAALEGAGVERLALISSPVDPSAFTTQFAARFGLTSEVIDRMMTRAQLRTGVRREDFVLGPRIQAFPAGRSRPEALVIHDRSDDEVPFADAQAWARAWPGAMLYETQGLGHRKILRDESVIARVLKFVGEPRPS